MHFSSNSFVHHHYLFWSQNLTVKVAVIMKKDTENQYLFSASLSISRVMLKMVIYLDFLLPGSSSDLPWGTTGSRMASCAVLLRMGFTEPLLLPEERWALTSPFHPYRPKPAVYFCCTFLRVASTGRYPASCPVKLGLSSPETFRYQQARPFNRLEILFYHSFWWL